MQASAFQIVVALNCALACSAQPTFYIQPGPAAGGQSTDKAVTGQPFMGDATEQNTQTLADGSHVTHRRTFSLARDSRGRMRWDGSLLSPPDSVEPTATISDAVAGVTYVLGPDHIAHRIPIAPVASKVVQAATSGTALGAAPPDLPALGPLPSGKVEDLGSRTIAGIEARGTRTTATITAGQAGNDNPLTIVIERWYSEDLQLTVLTKETDPRLGEFVYQLSNIKRVESPASLFQVPVDYTVKDGGK
jgi:hypothetical protein